MEALVLGRRELSAEQDLCTEEVQLQPVDVRRPPGMARDIARLLEVERVAEDIRVLRERVVEAALEVVLLLVEVDREALSKSASGSMRSAAAGPSTSALGPPYFSRTAMTRRDLSRTHSAVSANSGFSSSLMTLISARHRSAGEPAAAIMPAAPAAALEPPLAAEALGAETTQPFSSCTSVETAFVEDTPVLTRNGRMLVPAALRLLLGALLLVALANRLLLHCRRAAVAAVGHGGVDGSRHVAVLLV